MAESEIRERIQTEQANLVSLKMNHVISPLEDTSKIKKLRKDIARMKTVLTEIENAKTE